MSDDDRLGRFVVRNEERPGELELRNTAGVMTGELQSRRHAEVASRGVRVCWPNWIAAFWRWWFFRA